MRNHDPPVRKRTNIFKTLQKRVSQEAISTKTKLQLQTYSKAYKSRGQLYERMQRVTELFENTIFSSKTYNHDAFCTKTYKYL